MPILAINEIHEVHRAAVQCSLMDSRRALLSGIDDALTAGIPRCENPRDQMLIDLNYLNKADVFTSSRVPLHLWLATAASLTRSFAANGIFTRYLLRVSPSYFEATSTRAPSSAAPRSAHREYRSTTVAPRSEARRETAFNNSVYITPPPRSARSPRDSSRRFSWIGSAVLGASMAGALVFAAPWLSSVWSDLNRSSVRPLPANLRPASSPAPSSAPVPTALAPMAPTPTAPTPTAPVGTSLDFVSLLWDPRRPQCPTDPPEILLGSCDDRRDIAWLQRELNSLRSRGVEYLTGIAGSFVLRPRDSDTGVKNYFLNIHDASRDAVVGNVWFQNDGLHVTVLTRNPPPQVVLAYSRGGTWWIFRSGRLVQVP